MKIMNEIKFHQPIVYGDEFTRFRSNDPDESSFFISRGLGTQQCERLLSTRLSQKNIFLTPSCTAALEMMFLACDFKAGDEVILPSYTFSTTASSFALRGLKPVFVDVNGNDLCLNPSAVENAIGPKTKAVLVVHYGGWSSDLQRLRKICNDHKLVLFEDAAQAIGAKFDGSPLGNFGSLSAFSFHYTKNIHCGEGGALVVNDLTLLDKIERIYEKGTNRAGFLRGDDAFYTWTDLGSSFVLSETSANILCQQLSHLDENLNSRRKLWQIYDSELHELCASKDIATPRPHKNHLHSAHIFYLVFDNRELRQKFQKKMSEEKIEVISHYVPLHSSPMGLKIGETRGLMELTDWAGGGLIRVPIYPQMFEKQEYVIEKIKQFVQDI